MARCEQLCSCLGGFGVPLFCFHCSAGTPEPGGGAQSGGWAHRSHQGSLPFATQAQHQTHTKVLFLEEHREKKLTKALTVSR